MLVQRWLVFLERAVEEIMHGLPDNEPREEECDSDESDECDVVERPPNTHSGAHAAGVSSLAEAAEVQVGYVGLMMLWKSSSIYCHQFIN